MAPTARAGMLGVGWAVAALQAVVAAAEGNACPEGKVPWPRALDPPGYDCQDLKAARQEASVFLHANMPPWDLLNQGTLEGGILGKTVDLALTTRQRYSWAASVPRDIWQDWVLPYASVNEARSNWRPLLTDRLAPVVSNSTFQATSARQAAEVLNNQLWTALRPGDPIRFKSSQTPEIFDPMSVITFGFASCTGVSILFVDALRSVGIPARLVGTPAWHGKESDGNHNWVEVWLGEGAADGDGGWTFVEGLPPLGGETFSKPCRKWFCNPQHFDTGTEVFAARFDRHSSEVIYPLSWDTANLQVPGVNRTAYYRDVCGACGSATRALRQAPAPVQQTAA